MIDDIVIALFDVMTGEGGECEFEALEGNHYAFLDITREGLRSRLL